MDEYPIVTMPTDEILLEEEYEKLYSVSVEIVIVLSLFYGSISVMAIIGNTLVIWVVATTRQMRTVTNMYIANLAFADVIIALFCIPFQFQAALLQRWNLPEFMCSFCPFVQAVSVNVSVFTLTAIAIDRHRAIINPLRARPTKFLSKVIICTIWMISLFFAVPMAIAFRVEMLEERIREDDIIFNVTRPFCTNLNLTDDQLRFYRYALVFVQYLVPFCVISFVYMKMAIKLWGTRTPGNAQDTRDITLMKNKKKVIKMLIIVVVVFGLCWMPLQMYNILYVTIPEINEYHFINIIWFCCDWLAMSNSCYNPFIYGIYNEKFKREFNKRFSMCFCKFATSLDNSDNRSMSVQTRASSIRSTHATASTRIRNNIFGSQQNLKFLPSASSFRNSLQNHHKQTHFHRCNSTVEYNQKSCNNNKERKSLTFFNYNDCAEKNGNGAGGGGGGGNAGVCLWERHNFKPPLYPDLVETKDDKLTKAVTVTFPTSVANINIGIGKKAILKTITNNDEHFNGISYGVSHSLNEIANLRQCLLDDSDDVTETELKETNDGFQCAEAVNSSNNNSNGIR